MMWVNGEAATLVPATDRGLQYGDGVWETIRVRHGKPELLAWHWERLQQGLQVLRIHGLDWDALQAEVVRACQGQVQAVLKVIVTRGTGQRGYAPPPQAIPTRIVQVQSWVGYPADYAQHGLKVRLCQTRLAQQPLLAGIKHLNRLEQVLARAELAADEQEGLVCDTAGRVIEGTQSNLFVITQDGTVVTPDLSECGIAGVMRRLVMLKLAEMGIACQIHPVMAAELAQAQALFLTSSLMGVMPVREYNGKPYAIPPLVRTLQTVTDLP